MKYLLLGVFVLLFFLMNLYREKRFLILEERRFLGAVDRLSCTKKRGLRFSFCFRENFTDYFFKL